MANTTKNSYPRIVAKIHLTGQTSTIPTITILTPKKNELYRISVYGAITVPGNGCNGYWNLVVGWKDDAGTEQLSRMNLLLTGPNQFGEDGPIMPICKVQNVAPKGEDRRANWLKSA